MAVIQCQNYSSLFNFHYNISNLDNESISNSDSDFTLRLSESDSELFQLEITSVSEISDDVDIITSASQPIYVESVHVQNEDRPISPIFDLKKSKRKSVSSKSLDLKSCLLQEDEDVLSEESELELNRFKKINNKTNAELFISSDEEGSLLNMNQESNESGFGCKYYLRPRKSSYQLQKEGQLRAPVFIGPVTRSQTFKRNRLVQQRELEKLKKHRNKSIKSLIPVVSSTTCVPTTAVTKLLREKLRDMTLFVFL